LQSFVMFVRHISGAKNTVADWLSRMHAYLSTERVNQLSAGQSDISCLLICMLGYPGLKGPVVRFARKVSTVYATEQLGLKPDTPVPSES